MSDPSSPASSRSSANQGSSGSGPDAASKRRRRRRGGGTTGTPNASISEPGESGARGAKGGASETRGRGSKSKPKKRGGSSKSRERRKASKPSGPETTRYGTGRLVVGLQPVREVLRAHATRVVALLVADRTSGHESLEELAGHFNVPVHRVGRGQLDRLSKGASHQGVAALAPELVLWQLDAVLTEPPRLGIALDGVQDPQNFGAVIRSAVAVAEASVIWAEHGAAPLTPATFRASAGAVEHARLCRVRSLPGALLEAAQQELQIVGLDAHADNALSALDLTRPTIIVVGAESTGLSGPVKRACSSLASVVRTRKMDSLNASAAAAIALYEAQRQRLAHEASASKP